jgi:hypothetical protein
MLEYGHYHKDDPRGWLKWRKKPKISRPMWFSDAHVSHALATVLLKLYMKIGKDAPELF